MDAKVLKWKYPYSLLRLFAVALLAFPPLYFFEKSSLTLSMKPTGSCRPADSVATTQYAANQMHRQLKANPSGP
jgi:hypothetical protein